MVQSEKSTFQFKSFKVLKSLIEFKDEEHVAQEINIKINPSGIIDRKQNLFKLRLDVIILDENENLMIEISSISTFSFQKASKNLNSLFFLNSPAIVFPYIRSYISTLTMLSGINPIHLPTLNLTKLAKILEKNTVKK
jgi:preprotein translocase subunit SecB